MSTIQSSYKREDVIPLLKDLTGLIKAQSTEEREQAIQSGTHYCEMLPIEYKPTDKYIQTYRQALINNSDKTARAVAQLSENIYYRLINENKAKNIVLISLARAGIPIGILVKHYLEYKYKIPITHYAISIIRGKGIDHNAMRFILDRHNANDLIFIDGWTGKGAILNTLNEALSDYKEIPTNRFAVLADPANIVELCGTHEDFIIASSCLNSTVSGLMSRTILRDDLINKDDFHGAVYYKELEDEDRSYEFVNAIEEKIDYSITSNIQPISGITGLDETKQIATEFGVNDINKVKPSIGEATRVLLRRVPDIMLVKDKTDISVQHILQLAYEKNVEVKEYPLKRYKAVGIIKEFSDL